MEKGLILVKNTVKLGSKSLASTDILFEHKFILAAKTNPEKIILQDFFAFNAQLYSCHALRNDTLTFDPTCNELFNECIQIVDSSKALDSSQIHFLLNSLSSFNERYVKVEHKFHTPFCKGELMLKTDFQQMLDKAFLNAKDPLSPLHVASSSSTVKGEVKSQTKELKEIFSTSTQPIVSPQDIEAPQEKINIGIGYKLGDKTASPDNLSYTPFVPKEMSTLEWLGSFFKF